MKQIELTFFLAVLLSMAGVQTAYSDELCGNGVYYGWGGEGNSILYITKDGSGDGQMTSHPWTEDNVLKERIVRVEIGSGVTSICGQAFAGCPNLTSVSIPYSVTNIDAEAFSGCGNLETVTFTNANESQLKIIKANAFANCVKLSSITLPEGVEEIYDYAFVNCSALVYATLPSTLKEIQRHAFHSCTSLASVFCLASTPPTGGIDMFNNNASGRKIYVPSESIGAYQAAEYWSSYASDYDVNPIGTQFEENGIKYEVTQVVPKQEVKVAAKYPAYTGVVDIPATVNSYRVTAIGTYAFYNCSELTAVTIPFGVMTIDEKAFYGCTNLASVNIPEGVTTIGDQAFNGCHALTSIVIPNSVTSIGDWAFNGSHLLDVTVWATTPPTLSVKQVFNGYAQIHVPADQVSAYQTAWSSFGFVSNISGIADVTVGGITYRYTSPSEVKVYSAAGYTATSIVIPTMVNDCAVTAIGSGAFSGRTNLASAYIRAVTPPALPSGAFDDCASGFKIYVLNDFLAAYRAADNWSAYSSDILPIPSLGVQFTDEYFKYEITSNLEENRTVQVVYNNNTGSSITIPSSVEYAGNSYTVTRIAAEAFSGVAGPPKNFTLPATITSIGADAFKDINIASVTMEGAAPPVLDGSGIFDGIMDGCYIYVPAISVNSYKETQYWSAYASIIQAATTFWKDGIMYGNIDEEHKTVWVHPNKYKGVIDIPEKVYGYTVTGIEDWAFSTLADVDAAPTAVIIPATVTSLGSNVFNCVNAIHSLTSVTILAPTPPETNGYSLNGFPDEGKIYVFNDYVSTYRTTWTSMSSKIEAISTTFTLNGINFEHPVATNYMQVIEGDYSGVVNIPASAYSYSVTTIKKRAFYNCEGLTQVTIPNSVTTIDDEAFLYCSNLTCVNLSATTPPTLGTNVFDANVTIFVPFDLVSTYKESWPAYANAIYAPYVTCREAYWDETDKVVKYNDKNVPGFRVLDANTVKLEDGRTYTVSGTVDAVNRIVVEGTASIILCDGAFLNATKGISVGAGNTLNIYAQSEGSDIGQMKAVGSQWNAGIGGNNGNGGNVTIYGGNVNAQGYGSAGIGGGYYGDAGTVTIYGNNVTALGSDFAAGIGGGQHGKGGTVTIYGGNVNAQGGKYAAGIGGGQHGDAGTVTIYGNNVTALGSDFAAGIGGGQHGKGGTVTIYGGNVNAQGGKYAAGIGGGQYGDAGTVTIYGGNVTAQGQYTAGIGGGLYGYNGPLTVAEGIKVYGADDTSSPLSLIESPYNKRNKYMVIMESLTLNENTDNSTAIQNANGKVREVTLSGRTLYKDGNWNTLCLPFNFSAAQIAAHTDFAGAKLMELNTDGKNGFDATDGTLYLAFKEATAITAGVPYLVKWDAAGANFTSPVFFGVTINATATTTVSNADTGLAEVQMVGCYSPVSVDANDKSILFLGGDNTLYYSTENRNIRSCRAYFSVPYINQTPGAKARAFVLNFDDEEATGILEISADSKEKKDDAWYSLAGVRLSGKPTQRGMYINKGNKVIIK